MTNNSSDDADEFYTNKAWTVPYLFFLLIFGTIGNLCGLILFVNLSMRKYSCSLYFFLMYLCDEISLCSWIINRLSRELSTTAIRDRSDLLCVLYAVSFFNSSQASVGMLVLAMIDRLYTSFKLARGVFDTRLFVRGRKFQYICIAGLFSVLLPVNMMLFGSRLDVSPPDTTPSCVIVNDQINQIYSIIDLLFYAIIPFTCTSIGDVLILHYLNQTRSRLQSIHIRSKHHERQLCFMFVIASIISFFIVTPYSTLTLLINTTDLGDRYPRTMYTLNDIFSLFSTLTHAMHFYLFLIISSTIRNEFMEFIILCRRHLKRRKTTVRPALVQTRDTHS